MNYDNELPRSMYQRGCTMAKTTNTRPSCNTHVPLFLFLFYFIFSFLGIAYASLWSSSREKPHMNHNKQTH